MYVCIRLCLDWPLTENLKSADSNISRWMSTPPCTSAISAKPWERAWRVTARLQGQRERERLKTIQVECLGSTNGNLLSEPCYESDDRVTRQAVSDSQHWLQVRAWHDRSYIAWILLLAHGLTVKFSPCPCSHSSLAGRIAACLCGHFKCSLLLVQARPRMIQHLSSLECHSQNQR